MASQDVDATEPAAAPFRAVEFAAEYLDAAPDAVLVVDEQGEILSVNRHACQMLGYQPEELIGQPVERLVPDTNMAAHRAHRTRYRAAPRVRQMGEPGSRLCAMRADGSEVPVEIALSPVTIGGRLTVMAVMRDVTARMAAELEHELVRRTLDAVIDGVFLFDADSLEFTYVNDGAVRQTGYSRDELTGGMTPLHIKPEYTAETFAALIEPLVAGDVSNVGFETIHRRKDGMDVPVEINLQFPSLPIGPARLVAMVRDITERRASEERLRSSAQRLVVTEDRERIARDLHDVVIQRLFASGMQLQSVINSTDPAARERVSGQAEQTINDLDETISVIRETIFQLTNPDLDLEGRIGRVVDRHREIGPMTIDLNLDGVLDNIPEDIAEHVVPSLNEALSNVHRHADARRARVALIVTNERVVLDVADDGVGLDEETTNGFGLNNLGERAAELGGSLELTVGLDGRGTGLRWSVPVQPA